MVRLFLRFHVALAHGKRHFALAHIGSDHGVAVVDDRLRFVQNRLEIRLAAAESGGAEQKNLPPPQLFQQLLRRLVRHALVRPKAHEQHLRRGGCAVGAAAAGAGVVAAVAAIEASLVVAVGYAAFAVIAVTVAVEAAANGTVHVPEILARPFRQRFANSLRKLGGIPRSAAEHDRITLAAHTCPAFRCFRTFLLSEAESFLHRFCPSASFPAQRRPLFSLHCLVVFAFSKGFAPKLMLKKLPSEA